MDFTPVADRKGMKKINMYHIGTRLEVLDALVAVHDEAEGGELAGPVGDDAAAHAVELVLQLERLEAVGGGRGFGKAWAWVVDMGRMIAGRHQVRGPVLSPREGRADAEVDLHARVHGLGLVAAKHTKGCVVGERSQSTSPIKMNKPQGPFPNTTNPCCLPHVNT